MDDYKVLDDKEGMLKIDTDLIEIQKTIVYFGTKILDEIKEIKEMLRENKKQDNKMQDSNISPMEKPIITHLKTMKIPEGYKGNNLQW
jgi:hypothetical protein